MLAPRRGCFRGCSENFAPLDIAQVFDRLNGEGKALQLAAARVWLMGEPQTVALTNAVVLAAAEVVTAHYEPAVGRFQKGAALLEGRQAAVGIVVSA
jgi:hypothetical protein